MKKIKYFIIKLLFSQLEREVIYCSLHRMSKIKGLGETIQDYSITASKIKDQFINNPNNEELPLEI